MNYTQLAEQAFKTIFDNNVTLKSDNSSPNLVLNAIMKGISLNKSKFTPETFMDVSFQKVPKEYPINTNVLL